MGREQMQVNGPAPELPLQSLGEGASPGNPSGPAARLSEHDLSQTTLISQPKNRRQDLCGLQPQKHATHVLTEALTALLT